MARLALLLLSIFLFYSCKKEKQQEKEKPITGCYTPKTNDKDWYTSGKKAPLFQGLEGIRFTISTANSETQRYFNQGMMLAYGFNHAEAARSFYEATRIDSSCAMAYWGYAYVLGPNYNGGMEPDHYERAYAAVTKAQALSKNGPVLEKALINALATRYVPTPPTDRSGLDIAYAAAMKKVYSQYPSHPDIGALYAEAMMDLHPWDLYEKATLKPKTWTPELITILEKMMKTNPKHPGAHHFYIHALEASATPEKALASAHLLDTLVPGAGHMLHMPSHIYLNTGDYHLGTLANLRAVSVDSLYTTSCHAQGVYPLAYFPHNYHFLAATATLEGNSKLAWEAAEQIQKHTATAIMDQPEWGTLQHYYTIPYYIGVKFGMWDRLLALPAPEKKLLYPEAIWHYARGMAYIGKRDLTNAQKEADALKTIAADTSLKQVTIWNINSAADLVQIANHVLVAAIAAQKGQPTIAIASLQDAIAIEDKLNYNEPPDWFFSVRHHLGAVLIHNKKYAEAEKVYRQDLQTWKKNGWALIGLYQSLLSQKKTADAQAVQASFEQAWRYADVKIKSSSSVFEE